MLTVNKNVIPFKKPLKQLTFRGDDLKTDSIAPDPLNKLKVNLADIDSIGWVFSGGGAKGVFEVGVACALAKAGLIPDVIVGTSVGALNAAAMVSGDIDKSVDLWKGISKEKVYSSNVFRIMKDCAGQLANWFGIKNGTKLRSILDNKPLRKLVSKEVNPDELIDPKNRSHVELMLGVTALNDGKEGLFATPAIYDALKEQYEKGGLNRVDLLTAKNFEDAVIASSAIPIAFPAVQIDNELYVDGGAGNNTPAKNGVDALFALNKNLHEGLLFVVLLSPPEQRGDLKYEDADVAKVGFKTMEFVLDGTAKADVKTTQAITAEIEKWVGLRGQMQDGLEKIGQTVSGIQKSAAELLKLADTTSDKASADKLRELSKQLSKMGTENLEDSDKLKDIIQEYQPFNGKKKIKVVIIRPQTSLGIDTLEFDKAAKDADRVIKMGYETTLNALLSTEIIDRQKYIDLMSQNPYPASKKFPEKAAKKLEKSA